MAIVKLTDIAEKAEVSTATVSRILSEDPHLSVSDETRKKVLEIVKELNYKPLRRKRDQQKPKDSYQIGVVVTNDETIDPYFMTIRQGIESICEEYSIHIDTIFNIGKTDFTSGAFASLDGLIVVGDVNVEELREVYLQDQQIVFIDFAPENSNCDVVISDFELATREIMQHLLKKGHSDIAYIGGQGWIRSIYDKESIAKEDVRKKTYEEIMKSNGLYKEEHVLLGDFGPQSGYILMQKLITKQNLPSAVVVASDPMAIGVIRALHEEGIKVPEDVSIISFDDIEAAAFLNPPLSTVKIQTEEMGKVAVKLLFDRLKNGRDIPLKVVLPTELVLRSSTEAKE